MAVNNNSRTNSTEMNDEATNSLESQTQTTSINPRAWNVWKYFVNVKENKYMYQIFIEKNPHYNAIIKKNARRNITNFWRHIEIFHVALHDQLKGNLSRKKKSIVKLMQPYSQMKQY